MFLINLLIYILSFSLIWFGAGLIVSSATKFSSKLKLSPFVFSFVFLGLLTSIPEFSVGLQAVSGGSPGIFVGNLLGGVIILFLVVIPLLAIFGNGISLKRELDNRSLIVTLGIILAPAIVVLDKKVTTLEGIALILLYFILLFIVGRRSGIFNVNNQELLNIKAYSHKDIFKILFGVGIVLIVSNIIVDKTIYFANFFHISTFYISLIVISFGTNLPELTLAIRSVISGKREIAMGDYIGSASANTFLFGIFTILNNGEVLTGSRFFITFLFIVFALTLFYIFSISKNFISRREGIYLFGAYILFLAFELFYTN